MDKKKELLFKAYLVMTFFVGFALLVLWQVFTISIIEGAEWKSRGDNKVKWIAEEAERGNIYADDGLHVLASSVQFFEIRMDPYAVKEKVFRKDLDSLSILLALHSDVRKTKREWKKLLSSKRTAWKTEKELGSRYVLIAMKLNYDQYRIFKRFPIFRLGQNGGGFIEKRLLSRERPFRELAARTIGLDRTNSDKIGIEGYWDSHLRGETIKKLVKRIPGGAWMPLFQPSEIDSKKGADIITTLNIEIQDIVHNELEKTLKEQDAKSGVAIVMEVETGAIKAISNLDKISMGKYSERYNHAIARLSEPGSTFKLASVLAMLEDKHVQPSTKVNLKKGHKKFSNLWMHDSENHDLEIVSLRKAFERSSNVGIATLAKEAYKGRKGWSEFVQSLKAFGIHQKTGIDLEGEQKPYVKDPIKNADIWYGTTVPWMAHGYELKMTPLQVLNLYNAVANDGNLMKPYVVKEIIKNGKSIVSHSPEVLKYNIASAPSIKIMQEFLEGVVESGTASKMATDKYSFAGKTGTTSVDYSNKAIKKKHNASFAGYFPANKPKYSIIVVVYEPKKNYYGSKVALPVFRNIADRCYTIIPGLQEFNYEDENPIAYQLPKRAKGNAYDYKKLFNYVDVDFENRNDVTWVELRESSSEIKLNKNRIEKGKVPDVRGMGLKDAIYILENLGLYVKFEGSGKIYSQNILPGTKIKGQNIKLKLK